MDATMQYLFALLPTVWQPYVVLALLILYVVTKYRKTLMKRNQDKSAVWINEQAPVGFFTKVLDFFC